MNSRKIREYADDAIFLAPGFLFFAVIVLASFILGIYYSFTDWNGVNLQANWVGLRNYIKIFGGGDEQAATSAFFTLRFTVASVILSNLLAFALALGLTRALRRANLMKVIIFLPNVIGGIILGFIWRFILASTFPTIGEVTGIAFFELPWLGTPETGFWGSVIVFLWQRTGYLMVIYVAAILGINRDLIEAAKIDGASGSMMLRRVILPLVVPAITVCVFLSLSWTTKMFDVIFALTRGGPFGSTETFAMNIYFEAFTNSNYGLGSAKAILFFIVVATVTTIQVIASKRLEVEG